MQDDLPDDLVFPQDGPALQQDTLGVGVGVPPPVPDQAPSIEGMPDDLVFPQQPGTWQSLANSAERGARALYRDWQDLPGQVQGMEMAADLQRRIAAGEDSLWTRRFLDNPELLETFRRNYAENVATSAPIVAEQNRQISALPQHPAAEAMQRAQTWGEAWDHFTSAPLSVIANIGLESLVRQSPGLVAGAVAGAAGGVPALMATIGLGSAHTEYMGGIFDALTEAGVDITNADALRQALSNPELMERIRHQSAVKAGVVGAFDAASGGLASRVLLPATTLAARPVARHLTNIGVQIPTQGAMGGAGEALGSVASGQEVRPGAVMGEIVGEAFGAPAEVLGARHARGRTATEPPPQNQVPPAAQPAPAAEDQVPPVPPQEPAQPQAAISGFYAPAERAIETSRRVQGPPQAWFNDLKKAGVSNDELDWMGFPQWMEENRGRPVSREEMAEFVRENGANLVEVRQENEANGDLTQEELNFLNTQSVHETGRTFDQLDDSGKRELMNVLGVRQPTRYSSNFPAGVTNPRNFLVQVPGLNYQSPHFGGPTVSFIRVGDVAGPNGERVLLVHGNQSELHQEAEKRGYGDPPAQTGWETLDSPRVPVPNAPLKGDRWWQLGLKLALRQAVAEGYDAVAISTADQVKATDGNAPKSLYDSKMPSWLGKYVKPMGGVVEQAMTVPKNQRKKFSSREEALAAFPQGSTLNGAFPTWTVHAPGRRTIFGRSVGDRIGSINQLYDNEFEPLFRDPDYASSVLYESVPRYHPLVRITPQMRESIAKGQPLFSAHNSPTTKNAQESALDAVHEGGTADVPIRVADGILNDIRSGPSSRYLQMVPTDYEVGSLIMLEHVGDGHPNGDVNAVFLTTNDTYTSMRLPLSALDSLGALHVSPGYTDSGVGGLFFLRFDLPGEFSKRLAGELRHEAGHALRSSGKLRGKVWQRLLSHAHSLSSMGMSVRDYLFAKGDAYWQSAPESTTVNKAYTRIYEGRPDFQEVMDQEHVMVMLELHHHGYFSDEQMAPVRDILDAMESGSVARGEGVASSAEPVAAIAPPQSPRDLEDALQKLPPRTVGDITVETVRDRPSFGSITYVAKNSRNQKIGSFRLRMMSLTEVAVTNARVLDKFQRKGVASRVYDVIARDVGAMGMTLRPQGIDAGQMSDDAFAFWMKRDPSAIVRVADEEIALYGQLLMGGKEATKRYEQAKAKATPSKPVMAINGDEEAYQKAFEAQQRRKQMKQGKIAGGRMPPDQIARLNFARYSQGVYGSNVTLTDEERALGYEHVSEVVFDDVYGQQVQLRELSARLPGSWEDGTPPLLHSLRDADSGKFFYRGAPDIILSSELRQIAEQIVAHRLGLPPRSSGPVMAIAGVRAKTASKGNLAQAQEIAQRRADPEAKLADQFTGALLKAGYDSVILREDGEPYEMVAIKPGTVTGQYTGDIMFAIGGGGPVSLVSFIRAHGGIKDTTGDLRQILDKPGTKGHIPGIINNKTGVHPDRMRGYLVEAGYLQESGPDQPAVTGVNDVYDLVRRAYDGERILPLGEQSTLPEARASDADEIINEAVRTLDSVGMEYYLTEAEEARIVDLVRDGASVDDAIERATMESGYGIESGNRKASRSSRGRPASQGEEFPGWEHAAELPRDAGARDAGVGEGRTPEAAAPGGITGFTTAKGSTYVVHEDGTTTRNKALRSDPGHEGDQGLKPRSDLTVYVTEQDGQRFGPPMGVRWRVIDHGDGTLSLATMREDGRWGISPDQRNIPFQRSPSVGLSPVELWGRETIYGRTAYKKRHLGNPITAVESAAPEAAGTDIVPVTPPPLPPSSGGGSGMAPPGGGRGGRGGRGGPPGGEVIPPDGGRGGPRSVGVSPTIDGSHNWSIGDWARAARDKWYSLGRTMETWWNPINGLPQLEQYRIGRYRMLGRIGHGETMTNGIWKDFKGASKADKKAAYTYLTTRGVSPNGIADPKVRAAAVATKNLFNALGIAAVDRGLISQEALDKYRDQYLPRLYLEHILRKGSMLGFSGNARPSDLGWTKHRGDIDKETRVLMGEILDPGYLAARGIFRMHRDMMIIDFLSEISNNDDWVFARGLVDFNGKRVSPYFLRAEAQALRERAGYEPDDGYRDAMLAMATDMENAAAPFIRENENVPDGYKQIPDSKRYGMLRGMYVRKEIVDDLLPSMSLIPEDANWFEKFISPQGGGGKFNALWKAYHVPLNPSTQFRNTIGNVVLMNLSGMGPIRIAEALGKAVHQMATKGPIYKTAVDMGLKTSGFSEQELRNVSRAWLDAEATLRRENAWGTIFYPWQIIKHVHDTVLRGAGDLYQYSEGLFKTAMMIDAVENQGMTPEQGFLHAQKWLFDYSDVAKSVRYIRSSPIGIPFASFLYKSTPRLLEVAATKPWRFVPYVVLPYVMGQLFMNAWDAHDDDEEKKRHPNRPNPVDRLAMALPEYLRSKNYAFIMPWQDARGRWQFFDFGYLLPWAQIQETAQAAGKGDVTGAMRQIGFLGGPLLNLYQFIASKGIDGFTGRKVVDPRDPTSTQVLNTMQWVWDQVAPPLLTSKGAIAKIADAYNEVPDRSGDPGLTMAQSIFRLFGLNVYPVDPDTSRGRQISRMQYDIKETEKRRRSILRDQSLSPDARRREDEIRRLDIARRRRELEEYSTNSEVHPRLRIERPRPAMPALPNDLIFPKQ